MTVHVDEARTDDAAGTIDGFQLVAVTPYVAELADCFDDAAGEQHVARLVEVLRRIEDATAAKQHHAARRAAHRPPFATSASSGRPPARR